MGDAADYAFDIGELAYMRHVTGECGEWGPCVYCWQEREAEERMNRYIEEREKEHERSE